MTRFPRISWPNWMTRRAFLRFTAGAAGGLAVGGALGWPRRRARAGDGMRDVVVIGGGLSGLITAASLTEYDVLLLEREPEAGGRICTGTWKDYTYSMGAAYMGTPDAEMSRFFTELGVEPIPIPPPVDGMARGGKLYPEDYFAACLGTKDALEDYKRMARELAALSSGGLEEAVYSGDPAHLDPFGPLDQLTMETWLKVNGIEPVVQNLVDVENRGLFGVGNRDFSLMFDVPELAYNFHEPFLAFETMPDGPVPDFHEHRPDVSVDSVDTWTFPGGMMEVVDAMTSHPELSGRVQTGASVTRVTVNDDQTVTVRYRQGGADRSVRAYAAVLATPAPVTAKVVRGGLSERVMEALRAVRYTTYVTLALYTSRRMFRNAWNIACLDTCFTTLNDAVRTQVSMDHDGEAVLGVALPPRHAGDRGMFDLPDATIVDRAVEDAERYLPGLGGAVLGHDVKRFEHGFPVFGPGYRNVLHAIQDDPATRGPLFLAGDYTVYPTLGGAAVSGDLAASRVHAYAETLD